MRIFFMAVVAILFQLCTYALASGVQWLVRPWASDAVLKAVMIGLFVISNVILLLLITGSFRIGMSYLSVLWIAILAMALALVTGFLASRFGITLGHGLRVFGVASFIGLIALGLYNVYTPTVRHLSISIDKPMPVPVRIAVVIMPLLALPACAALLARAASMQWVTPEATNPANAITTPKSAMRCTISHCLARRASVESGALVLVGMTGLGEVAAGGV